MVITAADVSVAVNGDVRWESQGSVGIVQSYNGNTTTWTDDTTDANEATINDVLLAPFQITSVGDATYFGHTKKFSWVKITYSTAGNYTGGTSTWEYHNGTAWTTLTVTDPSSKFTATAGTYTLTFTPPANWKVITMNSIEGFYIRLNFSVAATAITTAPLGDQLWQNVGAGSGPYTVLELHRYLQDLADQAAASGDDLLDITSVNPSERSTDNIVTLNSPYNIDGTLAEHLFDGSITQLAGNTVYSGLVVVGNVFGTTTLQIAQNNILYAGDAPFWGTGINDDAAANILTRMIIMTRTGGADIDGKRIRVFAREWGETFAEFSVTMGLGNSVAAIFTNEDLNNATLVGTVSGYGATITNVEGYQLIDLDNGDGAQPYYSQWNRAAYTINDLYEWAKYVTRRGTTETLYGGMDGELFRGITHQITYTAQDASEFFEENEILTWATGTGRILADSEAGVDAGTTGTVWIQLLTGVAPLTSVNIADETGCNATTNVITSRSLSPVFLGISTGSAIIGAYGIGIEALDLSKNDLVFDLANQPRTPPNVVTFYIYGLTTAEDYVLIGPEDGAYGLDYDQRTLATTLSGAGETQVEVTVAIPDDTPKAAGGTIRIELDDGRYRKVAYTTWSTVFFTIGSTDFTGANIATAGNNVFITYIDKDAAAATESFQTKFDVTRTLFIRVRDGGGAGKGNTPIKSFETTTSLIDTGGSITAIRTPDL